MSDETISGKTDETISGVTGGATGGGISEVAGEVQVHLQAGREKSVRDGHPWIFSGAIRNVSGAQGAAVARVFTAAGEPLGLGLYSPKSQIRIRMLGREVERADRAFFAARLAEAQALRSAVVPADTTGYRLLNAEGDGVPGWTVDRFGDVLVSQMTVAGLEAVRSEAYAALGDLLPGLPASAILQANGVPVRRAEELSQDDEVIAGDPPREAPFIESGLRFTADMGGQKTGFYCDQRESRRRVERLAGGRRVLDLFAYTGAFGIYALRGGASRVTHVESAAKLVERGAGQYALNPGIDAGRASWVKANVFDDLRQRDDLYDLVICDPPPLVRKRPDLDAAARAYKDLNRLALGRLAPGGLLLTFSCSGAVDTKLFRQILFAAAVEARVRATLLEPLAAAPDHPVAITHPQGEYLKGWLISVQGPVL